MNADGKNNSPLWTRLHWPIVTLSILVLIGAIVGTTMSTPSELLPEIIDYSILPCIILIVLSVLIWKRKIDLDDDGLDDERIFALLDHKASPAIAVEGTNLYRCPSCEMTFEPINAVPEDNHVLLCPFCSARIYFDF